MKDWTKNQKWVEPNFIARMYTVQWITGWKLGGEVVSLFIPGHWFETAKLIPDPASQVDRNSPSLPPWPGLPWGHWGGWGHRRSADQPTNEQLPPHQLWNCTLWSKNQGRNWISKSHIQQRMLKCTGSGHPIGKLMPMSWNTCKFHLLSLNKRNNMLMVQQIHCVSAPHQAPF